MTLHEQLRALIERNHTRLLDQVATLTRLLVERDQGSKLGRAPIVEAQRLTHQMRGAAGSIGFGEIGTAAAALDESLKALRKGGRAISARQLGSALALLAALQRVAGESNPERSALYHADLSLFGR
jgi:HPt (histidine-containing phosphotransfer) domain-containing protein